MFKKIVFLISFIIFSLPFFWFALDCSNLGQNKTKPPICTSSPEVINKYLQDMVYIISLVNNAKSNSSWLWALWNKIKDTWLGSLWVVTMFSSNGVWNFFQNFSIIFKDTHFSIIFKDPHIVRDRVKITNFQQYITKKALKIASKWILNQNIENIKEIINYIKWKDSFIISFNWSTYKDLFRYLWKNQLFFEKVYYDKIVLKDNINTIESNIISDNKKNNLNYIVNSNSLLNLDNKLKVYDTKECNTSWNDFVADLKHVICTIWWDKLSKANKRFKWNYRRLLYVLNLWWSDDKKHADDKKYADDFWSVAYVETWVGRNRLKFKAKVEWIWTLSYWNTKDWDPNWWTTDKESLKKIAKDLKKYSWILGWIKEIWSELNPSNWNKNKNFKVSPVDYAITKQIDFVNTNLQAVIDDSNDVKTMLAWVEPWKATHGVTLLFPQISKEIDNIRNKIGKTVTDDGTIYKNIEKTCQNQSPQRWNCSYSP